MRQVLQDHQSQSNDEWAIAVTLADRRAKLERELIECLLCNRRYGLKLADAAGLTAGDFDQPDHRCIFAAMKTMRERPAVDVILAARWLIERFGLWDDSTPAHSTGMRHSLASLVRLACRTAPRERIPLLIATVQRLGQIFGRAAA